jgi:hypothetical protein
MYQGIVATPLVPFGILNKRACAGKYIKEIDRLCVMFFIRSQLLFFPGVMVTASHNPKQDNGYKVYWQNGSQIISPHDEGISNCISRSLKVKLPLSYNTIVFLC